MKKISYALILTLLLSLSNVSAALALTDLVVIANPESGINQLTRDEVTAIYMGRTRRLASGLNLQPLDQAPSNTDKAHFYIELINKNLSEINAYWSRLVFSGQGKPPTQVDNAAAVVNAVAQTKGAIGYVPRSMVTKQVKVVLDLNVSG